MSEPEPVPLGKAIRRSPWERADLARLDDAAIEAGRAFWHDHAPEGQEGLIDAEPINQGSGTAGAIGDSWHVSVGPLERGLKGAWQYLTKSRAYRAVASGLTLAASAVRSAVERVTGAGEGEARELGERVRDGKIDLPAWQTGMEAVIRKAHAAAGLVGAGGRHAATPKELDAIERRVLDQLTWLEAFAIEIEAGLPLDNKIPDRCSQYATAAIGTYEASRRKGDLSAGWSWERRILHSVVPCAQCTRYAERGWQPALVLPDVGEECECASRCKCTFERSQTDPRRRPVMATRALEYLFDHPLLCTVETARTVETVLAREGDIDLAVARREAAKLDGSAKSTIRDGVAVIPIRGPISRYGMMMEDISPLTSDEAIKDDLDEAVRNPAVRAILLSIDSPGGEVNGTAEHSGYIRAADAVKPVVAYVGGQASSKAFWYAASAGEVVCSPTAQLGSVGVVFSGKRRSANQAKSEWVMVSDDSPMKRVDVDTDEGKAEMMKTVNAVCSVFISQVATLRGVSPEKVKSDFGRGGVLVGQAAVDAGMADSVGDFESTLARLSRGERLGKPKPKPGKPAAADTPRGKQTMNPFKILASLYKTDPDKVNAAIAESGDEGNPFAAVLAQGQVLKTETGVDADAVEKQIEARAQAKADAAVRVTLAKSFATYADAFVLAMTKAEKLAVPDGPAVKALYVELALADHSGPLAVAEGKTTDRLSVLTSLINGKASGGFTKEHVGADGKVKEGMQVLPHVNGDDNKPKVDADRVLTMLSATPEGQAELARRAKAQ